MWDGIRQQEMAVQCKVCEGIRVVFLDSYNMIPRSNNYCLCFMFSLKQLVEI